MILLTGATGLIGSHLLYRLVAKGQKVRILVRDKSRIKGIKRVFSYYTSDPEALWELVTVVRGDLLDKLTLPEALKDITHVYHCAAVVSFNPSARESVIEANRASTANLVDACLLHGVEKLVHVSSTSAVGKSDDGSLITEDVEWSYSGRVSGYSVGKHESEREAWRAEAEGMKVVIVNPAMVIGPGNWGESSTGLIKKCYDGLMFYTLGVNAYVDVRDVAEVMDNLMESDISGERYLLVSENITFRSLFEQISNALGKKPPRYRARRWMGEIVWRIELLRSMITGKAPLLTKETARTAMQNHYYSSEKIRKELNFKFRPLSETIEWTCSRFLDDLKH